MIRFLANLAVNLQATGPAAVLIAWMVCLTLLGLYGNSENAGRVITFLGLLGIPLIAALGTRA